MTKETLVAYTIAVVQNTQTLQYKQMQVTLQMAQNQASLETLLWAEPLMTAHFNLAVLTDEPSSNKNFNAPKPKRQLLTLHRPLQQPMRRHMLRFQAEIIVQVGTPRGYNPQELSHQLMEENTILSTASRQVMSLMILGAIILLLLNWSMSTTTTKTTPTT